MDNQGNIHIVYHDETDYDGAGGDSDIFYKIKDSSTGLWSAPEVVSTSSDFNSYGPELAVDSFGNAHVVWYDNHDYDGTDLEIIYKKRDATSDTWSAPTVISTDSTSSSYSPVIVVDNSDIVHVAWEDYTAGLYGSSPFADICYKRWDPVNFWSSGFIISYESLADDSYNPTLVVDDTNSIHVAWSDNTDMKGSGASDTDVFHRKWDSSSSTWSDLTLITPESSGSSTRPLFTIDSHSNIHFVWIENDNIAGSGYDIDAFYRYYDPDTESLSDLVLLTENSDDQSYASGICYDSKEHFHVLWYDYSNLLSSGSDRDIFYKKYAGPPGTPTLHPITPAISTESNISLTWSEEISADSYKIYRSSSYIVDISGLTVLDTTSNMLYFDSLNESGVYYYAVVASNDYGDSGASNNEVVEYQGQQFSNLFANLDWGEIIIIAGFLGVLQIISVVVIFLAVSANKSSSSSKKGKKK